MIAEKLLFMTKNLCYLKIYQDTPHSSDLMSISARRFQMKAEECKLPKYGKKTGSQRKKNFQHSINNSL